MSAPIYQCAMGQAPARQVFERVKSVMQVRKAGEKAPYRVSGARGLGLTAMPSMLQLTAVMNEPSGESS